MTTADQTLVALKALAIYKAADGEHVMLWLDSDVGRVLASMLAAYPSPADACAAAQRTLDKLDDLDTPSINLNRKTGKLSTGMLVLRTADTDLPVELPSPCIAFAVSEPLSVIAAVPSDVVAAAPDHSIGDSP